MFIFLSYLFLRVFEITFILGWQVGIKGLSIKVPDDVEDGRLTRITPKVLV